MRHVALRSILACSLALAVGMPARAHALTATTAVVVEDAEAPRRGRVFVDAGALGDPGPYLAGEATRRAGDVLVGEGVKETDAPAGPELRITITPGETTGYSVAYEIVYDGEVVEDGTGASDCQLCTEGELLDLVDAIAKEQAPKMVEPAPEPDQIDPKEGEGDGDGVKITSPGGGDGETDEPKGMGGMGKAGIALLVGGGVAAGVGVGLTVRKPNNLPVGDNNANKLESTRPTGAILLGGGLALAVTGAVLLAVDIKRRKRAREGAAPGDAEARLGPWLGPSGAGLSIVGRF